MSQPSEAPCCGTATSAREAGSCCDPAAKRDALAVGATCCRTDDADGGVRALGKLPVIVIGAGPVGLAAAAHLHDLGVPFLVVEAGDGAGTAIAEWGHVRLFSPWRLTLDHAARALLESEGWSTPDTEALPTGTELVDRYLRPLAALPQLAPHIRYATRVAALSRLGIDRIKTAARAEAPFTVRLDTGEELAARAVIDASGSWRTPNVLGVNGLPAHGEETASGCIETALPDVLGAHRSRYANRHTLVVGSGHSAANTLIALAALADSEPDTRITWVLRGDQIPRRLGGQASDALPARGALGARLTSLIRDRRVNLVTAFGVHAISATGGDVTLSALDGREVTGHRVVAATGFRPDHGIAAELRLDLDPILGCTRALAPLIDPNQHSCGTVPAHGVDELTHPEPGYYIVGMKSYGRAPTFLLATGYEQVRSITAALAGEGTSARRVQLDLPATGVCNTDSSRPTFELHDISQPAPSYC